MSGRLSGAWRRFRRLPGGLQLVVGAVVLAGYTVLAVLLLGGDGDQTPEEAPLSAVERQVERAVIAAELPQRDGTDVAAFRKPEPQRVECKDDHCRVVYSIAVPGRGRLLIQQSDMVRRIFDRTDVQRVRLDIVRGLPSGPLASPAGDEETPGGLALVTTSCDRSELAREPDWSEPAARAVVSRICVTRDFNQGAQHGRKGQLGRSARGE